jgi:glycosyltransferase involved in cell wall biosynthesis
MANGSNAGKGIIASHRLTPGHLSHMLANGQLLKDTGWDVVFRVPPGLADLVGDGTSLPLASSEDLANAGLYVLWAPSLQGLQDVIALRLKSQARVVYVLHEPYTSFRSYREAGFSFLKTLRVFLIHYVSSVIVALSHAVVLPSLNARSAFERRYRSRRAVVVPLMFVDEATQVAPQADRSFVSYIGTIAEDHAFDQFVAFVEQSLQSGWLEGYRFLIATRSVLPPDVQQRLDPYIAAGRVEVRSGRPLSNREINSAYGSSLVIWNAYRRSMQSGVLPKAYMFGTPVLVSAANRNEFFVDGEHGAEVSTRYDAREIAEAVQRVVKDFSSYSRACRAAFFFHFHYRANAAAFLDAVAPSPNAEVAS